MDDERTMFFSISTRSFVLSAHNNEAKKTLLGGATGVSFGYEYLPNTTDWYERWRLKANASNDYFIDREVQRHDSYTGIEGLAPILRGRARCAVGRMGVAQTTAGRDAGTPASSAATIPSAVQSSSA
jgi:hypothetical protein